MEDRENHVLPENGIAWAPAIFLTAMVGFGSFLLVLPFL